MAAMSVCVCSVVARQFTAVAYIISVGTGGVSLLLLPLLLMLMLMCVFPSQVG